MVQTKEERKAVMKLFSAARRATTKGKAESAKNNAKNNAKTAEEKRLKREADELVQRPSLDLSASAKKTAAIEGISRAIEAYELHVATHAKESVAVNVFGASEGSISIQKEGALSALTTRGYDTPAIVKHANVPRGWCALNGKERRALGPVAIEIYDAGWSKEMSKHVEKEVQLYFQENYNIKVLWRVPGAGGPKGYAPYKVGIRFMTLTSIEFWFTF